MKAYLLLTLAPLLPLTASAVSVVIPDGSFEGLSNSVVSDNIAGGSSSGNIGNWDATATNLAGFNAAAGAETDISFATNGTNVGFMRLDLGVGNTATMTNTLSHETQANASYLLTFDIGTSDRAPVVTVTVLDGNDGVLGQASAVDLATLINSGPGMHAASISFTTGASPVAGNISIEIDTIGLIDFNSELIFDNFEMSYTPVPEPHTYALIFSGLVLGVVAFRKRRAAA